LISISNPLSVLNRTFYVQLIRNW